MSAALGKVRTSSALRSFARHFALSKEFAYFVINKTVKAVIAPNPYHYIYIRSMKKSILITLLSALCALGQAQTLTLEECYELARANFLQVRRLQLIERTRDCNLANAAKGTRRQARARRCHGNRPHARYERRTGCKARKGIPRTATPANHKKSEINPKTKIQIQNDGAGSHCQKCIDSYRRSILERPRGEFLLRGNIVEVLRQDINHA